MLSLFDDLDDLLSTHEGFLLAPALHAARSWGTTNEERVLMEKNLKLQITVWGESPSGDTELSDYANKEWSGLVRSFYKERSIPNASVPQLVFSGGKGGWIDFRKI